MIVSPKNLRQVWSTPSTLQTTVGCGSVQRINREWRFGYEGEELPYQSALTYDEKYHNHIAIDQAGQYRLVARFDSHTIEKEFAVVSDTSGNSISAEARTNGTTVGVQINNKD